MNRTEKLMRDNPIERKHKKKQNSAAHTMHFTLKFEYCTNTHYMPAIILPITDFHNSKSKYALPKSVWPHSYTIIYVIFQEWRALVHIA